MESRSHAVVAIVFFMVFSMGIAVIYIWLHRGPREDRYYEIISSYGVGGLQPEAAVEFKGLRIGSVKRIYFDPGNPGDVIIRIGVFPDAYVTQSTYATLGYRGITGLTYIDLDNDPANPGSPLPTDPRHPARIPMRKGMLQVAEEQGMSDLKQVKAFLDRANRLLSDDNRRHLSALLSRLDDASRRLVDIERQLTPAARTMPAIAAETSRLLRETADLESTVDHFVRDAGRPVQEIGGAARSVTRLGDSGDRLADRVTDELLPRLDALLERMNQTIGRIDRLTRDLRSRPQSLIFGPAPRPAGPGEPGFQPPAGK